MFCSPNPWKTWERGRRSKKEISLHVKTRDEKCWPRMDKPSRRFCTCLDDTEYTEQLLSEWVDQ